VRIELGNTPFRRDPSGEPCFANFGFCRPLASLRFAVICEKRDLLKIAAVGQPGSVTGQAWVHKGVRTLLAVAPGLGFFLIKGDPLGVGFAFAALCLSVAYNDQSFRPIHLVSMAGAAAGLMPVAVWLHEHAVLYVLGFALVGAGSMCFIRAANCGTCARRSDLRP
jgi:hypothetical protein